MANLIANGELLRLVRAKLNAAVNPYASRAEFEAANIPSQILMVYVIDGSDVYALIRDQSGDWASGDGAKWTARIDGGLSSELLAQAVADSAASRDASIIASVAANDAKAQAYEAAEATAADLAAIQALVDVVGSGLTGWVVYSGETDISVTLSTAPEVIVSETAETVVMEFV